MKSGGPGPLHRDGLEWSSSRGKLGRRGRLTRRRSRSSSGSAGSSVWSGITTSRSSRAAVELSVITAWPPKYSDRLPDPAFAVRWPTGPYRRRGGREEGTCGCCWPRRPGHRPRRASGADRRGLHSGDRRQRRGRLRRSSGAIMRRPRPHPPSATATRCAGRCPRRAAGAGSGAHREGRRARPSRRLDLGADYLAKPFSTQVIAFPRRPWHARQAHAIQRAGKLRPDPGPAARPAPRAGVEVPRSGIPRPDVSRTIRASPFACARSTPLIPTTRSFLWPYTG
jgi:hypothetical protein